MYDLEEELGFLILKLQHTWAGDRGSGRMTRQEREGLWAQLPSRDDQVTPQLRQCVRPAPGVSAPMSRVEKKRVVPASLYPPAAV